MGMVSEEPSHNSLQPGYKVCWLYCADSAREIYAGMVSYNQFVGNKLTLVFSQLARVHKVEDGTWRRIVLIQSGAKLEFEGCNRDATASDTGKICFISSSGSRKGDKVVFSNDEEEIRKVTNLLTE